MVLHGEVPVLGMLPDYTRGRDVWDPRRHAYVIYSEDQGPVGMVYDEEWRRYVAIVW